MERQVPKHRGVYILPNLFTTASLFSAFLGILWAASGQYDLCAQAILFSALMDGLDGKVARLTGTSSEFGVQYDSLCDLVAFGVAPAFMSYRMALMAFDRLGIAICFLFVVCSALRLARFNVSASSAASKRFFTGLPTPAAGCALALLVMMLPHMPDAGLRIFPYLCLFITATLALLMVSSLRYAAFKDFGLSRAHAFRYMVFAILIFALIVVQPRLFGFLILYGYILSGIVVTLFLLPRARRRMARYADTGQSHHSGGQPDSKTDDTLGV